MDIWVSKQASDKHNATLTIWLQRTWKIFLGIQVHRKCLFVIIKFYRITFFTSLFRFIRRLFFFISSICCISENPFFAGFTLYKCTTLQVNVHFTRTKKKKYSMEGMNQTQLSNSAIWRIVSQTQVRCITGSARRISGYNIRPLAPSIL